MENFIIAAVRVLMWIGMILGPALGFVSGGVNGAHQLGVPFHVGFAILGGVFAFITAVLLFGVIAILLKIEVNTRTKA